MLLTDWINAGVIYGSLPAFLGTCAVLIWHYTQCSGIVSWTCKRRIMPWIMPALAAGLIASTVWVSLYPVAWRVVSDEFVIAATARSLTESGRLETPTRGYYEGDGTYRIAEGIIDKRPAGFPALGAVANWVMGYDPYRLNQVNLIAATILVVVMGILGGYWGRLHGFLLGVFITASMPLLALLARSGTNEIVAIIANLQVALWMGIWLRNPSRISWSGMLTACVFLTHVRYEGVLWFMVAVVALCARRRHLWKTLWPGVTVVLLGLPPVIQQLGIHLASKDLMQVDLARDGKVFSVDYVVPNLITGWKHFITPTPEDPSNPGLWIVLFGSLLFMAHRRWRMPSLCVLLTLGALVALCQPALLLAHYWGQYNSALVWRHLLPLYVAGTIALLWVIPLISQFGKNAILCCMILTMATFSAPRLIHRTAEVPLFAAGVWLDNQTHSPNIANAKTVVISNVDTRFVAMGMQTVNLGAALRNPEAIHSLLQKGVSIFAYVETFDRPGNTVTSTNWEPARQEAWTQLIRGHYDQFMDTFTVHKLASFDSGGPFLRKHYWVQVVGINH